MHVEVLTATYVRTYVWHSAMQLILNLNEPGDRHTRTCKYGSHNSTYPDCVQHSGEESLQLGVARFVAPLFRVIHP